MTRTAHAPAQVRAPESESVAEARGTDARVLMRERRAVLPSTFIAWGVALLAAMAAGGLLIAPMLESRVPILGALRPREVHIETGTRHPELLEEVKVPYPLEARRAGIEGTVRLLLVIDGEGRVTEAVVLSGPGHGLNEAAHEALVQFKFKPAAQGGRVVPAPIVYNYTFKLD